jgi:hypothetical protein
MKEKGELARGRGRSLDRTASWSLGGAGSLLVLNGVKDMLFLEIWLLAVRRGLNEEA